QIGVGIKEMREIDQASADAPRERSLGETGADRGRNLGHGHRMIEAANGTVGKRDVGHDRVSGSSCPRRRRGRGYETKNVDEKKAGLGALFSLADKRSRPVQFPA